MADKKIADVHDKAEARADQKHDVAQHKLDDAANEAKHRAAEKVSVKTRFDAFLHAFKLIILDQAAQHKLDATHNAETHKVRILVFLVFPSHAFE